MKITTSRHQISFKAQDKSQNKTEDKPVLIMDIYKSKQRPEVGQHFGTEIFLKKAFYVTPFFAAMGGVEIIASKLKLLKNPPFLKKKPSYGYTVIAFASTIIGLAFEKEVYRHLVLRRKKTYEQYKESADRFEGNVKKIFNAINLFKS